MDTMQTTALAKAVFSDSVEEFCCITGTAAGRRNLYVILRIGSGRPWRAGCLHIVRIEVPSTFVVALSGLGTMQVGSTRGCTEFS